MPNIFQILCKYFTVFLQTLQRDKNFDKLTGDDFNWRFLLSWPIKIRKKFHCGMLILKVKMRAGIWYPGMVGWVPFTVRPRIVVYNLIMTSKKWSPLGKIHHVTPVPVSPIWCHSTAHTHRLLNMCDVIFVVLWLFSALNELKTRNDF